MQLESDEFYELLRKRKARRWRCWTITEEQFWQEIGREQRDWDILGRNWTEAKAAEALSSAV